MRVNARLDGERAGKLRQLPSADPAQRKRDRQAVPSTSCTATQSERSRDKLDALLSSDFVGCANGPADLASQYKRYLTRDLEDKHGDG